MQLPNFFIIGAPKCGTTALYHHLKQHPEIYMSPVKEPHFFTFEGEAPVFAGPGGGYFRRVAVSKPRNYLLLFANATDQRAIGEASPSYLRSPIAAVRIKRNTPDAKIIAILRQPANRAYSQHQYMLFHGVEPAHDFSEALTLENSRKCSNWSSTHYYREGGFYYSHLRRYFDLFPREHIRIYLYEDWNASPHAVLQDLFRFLDVDENFAPELLRSNVTLTPQNHRLHQLANHPERIERLLATVLPMSARSKIISGLQRLNRAYNLMPPPPIDPEVRRQLTDGYREDILKTQDLIGRDLSHWLQPK